MNMSLKDKLEQQVGQIILDIIAIVAPDADLSNVKPNVGLRDQLDMDSMDFLDIVMELRKRYKVEVPKEEYPKLATLRSCVEYLTPGPTPSLLPIWR